MSDGGSDGSDDGRPQRSRGTTGLILALTAYGLWGLFPFYFHLLADVSPIEVVAHRVIWSLAFLVILITVTRQWPVIRAAVRNPRAVVTLAVAALLLSVNWGVYVYAVFSDQIVEASLGYFINPLVTVALGVLVLREHLRPMQWVAVGLGVLSVVVLGFTYGTLPWVGLTLAITFGAYGLLKKSVGYDAVPSLTIETAALLPLAVIVVVTAGTPTFGHDLTTSLLMVGLGPVTALPLLAFAGAANRVPLTTLGMMQYLTPVMIFVIGVVVFGESMPVGRWVGFGIVWVALIVFTIDILRHSRRPSTLDRLEITEPD